MWGLLISHTGAQQPYFFYTVREVRACAGAGSDCVCTCVCVLISINSYGASVSTQSHPAGVELLGRL